MNAPLCTTHTLTATALQAAFAQIPEDSKAQAERLGVEILWNEDGFGIWVDGDSISGDLTAEGVQIFLDGFECGHDSINVPTELFSELVAAEQIIRVLFGYLDDGLKQKFLDASVAIGVAGSQSAARTQERHAAIAAARAAAGAA